MKTKASGICSSDFMGWYIQRKAPLVFDHEPAGEVVEVGSEVTEFKPGDRVFAHHHAPCFKCNACRRGAYPMCETWKKSRLPRRSLLENCLR
ncbi:MAG: alcohol dehydrogenase catalytic domain-containing protein [Firmicutes bacterium]|nr:alcohol dehydrogenase catalytic domain-containing protein [Bacillota bacterium]